MTLYRDTLHPLRVTHGAHDSHMTVRFPWQQLLHADMDPNSEGPLYCAEQIKIPAELPDILKEFTKAAIRTQPSDLLQWSAA